MPGITREDVLNPTRPALPAAEDSEVRAWLDERVPGASRALDTFWQAVADGSLRLGETAAATLGPVIAPVQAGMRLLPARIAYGSKSTS